MYGKYKKLLDVNVPRELDINKMSLEVCSEAQNDRNLDYSETF